MAEKIAEDLWRLEIPLPGSPLKNLNSYLIRGERSLLVDTGFCQSACREAMERQLRELGVELTRTDIFLTHLHTDHTGLSTLLHRPGCRVFLGEVDAARMLRFGGDTVWREMWDDYVRDGFSRREMDALWDTNPAKNAGPALLDAYDTLSDGAELRYGGRTLRCVLTPGHTPGHLCLYDAEARLLFSGDHILYHITPNICRWSGVADSLGDYLESLQKVCCLPVERVLPAHRAAEDGLVRRADQLTAHHRRRAADALNTVTREPGLTAYEIAGRMAWSIRCRNWADFPQTQKFFAVGEALAHLDYLAARGAVRSVGAGGVNRWYPAEKFPISNDRGES